MIILTKAYIIDQCLLRLGHMPKVPRQEYICPVTRKSMINLFNLIITKASTLLFSYSASFI